MSDALELAKRALQHFNRAAPIGALSDAHSTSAIPMNPDSSRAEAVFFDSPIAVALSLSSGTGDFQHKRSWACRSC